MILISLSAIIKSSQNAPIVGTWIGIDATGTQNKTVYTTDHKVKYFHKGNLMATKNYKLSSTPNHCVVDMSVRLQRYPENKILIVTNPETGKERCALVYELTDELLVMKSYQSFTAGVDSLKKVQP